MGSHSQLTVTVEKLGVGVLIFTDKRISDKYPGATLGVGTRFSGKFGFYISTRVLLGGGGCQPTRKPQFGK